MRRIALVVLLLATLFASVPLAYASPPDQSWLGGWYDNGDFDDVVLAITSAVGTLDARPAGAPVPRLIIVDTLAAPPASAPPVDNALAVLLRAPPRSA